MNHEFERELAGAIRAVRAAARLCRAVRAETLPEVVAKSDKSPVTVADFGSQAVICRALLASFPHDPVIAEEDAGELRRAESAPLLEQVVRHVRRITDELGPISTDAAVTAEQVCHWIDHGGTNRYGDRFWTLDPIDGTKGFLRSEQYAVALALVVGGQIEVAALACPHFQWQSGGNGGTTDAREGLIYSAVRGQGAFVTTGEEPGESEPKLVRVAVSGEGDPSRAVFCESVESGHSAHGDAARVASHLGITRPPLRMDSQAKYAAVARGEADIYLRLPTRSDYREKIWDHAAGALIVAEAGGAVTDVDGRPLEFTHGRELVANRGAIVTNGRLHQAVIDALGHLGIGSG